MDEHVSDNSVESQLLQMERNISRMWSNKGAGIANRLTEEVVRLAVDMEEDVIPVTVNISDYMDSDLTTEKKNMLVKVNSVNTFKQTESDQVPLYQKKTICNELKNISCNSFLLQIPRKLLQDAGKHSKNESVSVQEMMIIIVASSVTVVIILIALAVLIRLKLCSISEPGKNAHCISLEASNNSQRVSVINNEQCTTQTHPDVVQYPRHISNSTPVYKHFQESSQMPQMSDSDVSCNPSKVSSLTQCTLPTEHIGKVPANIHTKKQNITKCVRCNIQKSYSQPHSLKNIENVIICDL